MISKEKINQAIKKAEKEYIKCWQTLENLKTINKEKYPSSDELLSFQGRLAQTLFDLEKIYSAISEEGNIIIKRKKNLSPTWLKRRLRTLSEYKEFINSTLAVGKFLGDSFAWIFYRKNREYLIEHQQHERVPHISAGVGGMGEIAFINQVKFLHGSFVLYHGITNFLRVGDISLIDIEKNKVVAVGELKTGKLKDGQAEVMVIYTGPKIDKEISPRAVNKADYKLSQSVKESDRFKRQLKQIPEVFKVKEPDKKIDQYFSHMHIDELKVVCQEISEKHVAWQKAGDNLVIVGLKNKKDGLASQILKPTKLASIQKKLIGFENFVNGILKPNPKDNSLFINSLFYTRSSESYLFPGMTPLFWWPLDLELIRQIIFQETIVFTLFNPASLIQKIRNEGFIVDIVENDHRKINVSIQTDKLNKYTIENFSYFLWLIELNLFAEDYVIDIIKQIASEISSGNIPPNSRIELNIQQHFM